MGYVIPPPPIRKNETRSLVLIVDAKNQSQNGFESAKLFLISIFRRITKTVFRKPTDKMMSDRRKDYTK
jgi:hypothetical protein